MDLVLALIFDEHFLLQLWGFCFLEIRDRVK